MFQLSSAPASFQPGFFLETELEDYRPVPPAVHLSALAALPSEESSNITLQREIFDQLLNSSMGAAGFRCLSQILEEQYVAASLKYKEKALMEKIRVRVEDTVELIVDYAENNFPIHMTGLKQMLLLNAGNRTF